MKNREAPRSTMMARTAVRKAILGLSLRPKLLVSLTLLYLLQIQGVKGWVPRSLARVSLISPSSTASATCLSAKADLPKYDLGLGKNPPLESGDKEKSQHNHHGHDQKEASKNWMAPVPIQKPVTAVRPSPEDVLQHPSSSPGATSSTQRRQRRWVRTRKLVSRSQEASKLRGAVWDEAHYQANVQDNRQYAASSMAPPANAIGLPAVSPPSLVYPNIDLSIPESVYSSEGHTDAVWELLRYEAHCEAQREPLLVSFLHSTILNHHSLESALAFHLANRLSSPAMISTQIQSLILEALEHSPEFRRNLRADILAVRDRDPACTCLPDVFLYFKGFHALQTHRVAHYMYRDCRRQVLAHYLQSQVSQNFQIDIHPNATLGSGIMLDHGTGIVIGETATVGHNCSILHHVTLGGSGKKGVERHPKVGNGVLLGAGASVLGNVHIGDGCQIGAGTLVISDLPAHSVAVGVPAKIIGSFVDVTEQPSIGMNQMTGTRGFDEHIRPSFENSGEYI